MDTKIIAVSIFIAVVLIVSIFQMFQLNDIKNKISVSATAGSGSIDMNGWTADEKMNYEMHGIIPARFGGGSSGGMVGGC